MIFEKLVILKIITTKSSGDMKKRGSHPGKKACEISGFINKTLLKPLPKAKKKFLAVLLGQNFKIWWVKQYQGLSGNNVARKCLQNDQG